MPVNLLFQRSLRKMASGPSVAVIGGGFAGLSAGYVLSQLGFNVTILEASAGTGGRVSSSTSVVSGRIIERGAELIGTNHPLWLAYAQIFGLSLVALTSEDLNDSIGLESPMYLKGQLLDVSQQEALATAMNNIFTTWCQTAVTAVPGVAAWIPWIVDDAATLDGMNLSAQIPEGTDPDVVDAINTTFYLNNCVDPAKQSWLANLAQFSAGASLAPASDDDPTLGFFDDTEVFRCANGNQALATALSNGLTINYDSTITSITTSSTNVTIDDTSYDFAILAVPVAQLANITVNGANIEQTTSGPAVKYLVPLADRFWIGNGQAPTGMSDVLGMTWEGTDNQNIEPGAQPGAAMFDLSTFIGGQLAQDAIDNGGSDSYFQPLLANLFTGLPSSMSGDFVDWPSTANIGVGYSSPTTNQVTTLQQKYAGSIDNRLFFAGEHTSPAWFGYMEGALESGFVAAIRIAMNAGVNVSPSWGGTAAVTPPSTGGGASRSTRRPETA